MAGAKGIEFLLRSAVCVVQELRHLYRLVPFLRREVMVASIEEGTRHVKPLDVETNAHMLYPLRSKVEHL